MLYYNIVKWNVLQAWVKVRIREAGGVFEVSRTNRGEGGGGGGDHISQVCIGTAASSSCMQSTWTH